MFSKFTVYSAASTTALYWFNSDIIYTDEANYITQNMKFVTCTIRINPFIMFSLQAASTTY